MHIYFSGIGGVGLGPLAEIAHDAGYNVAGSDKSISLMTDELQARGITVRFDQSGNALEAIHAQQTIDWFVYSSALSPTHPELIKAQELGLKITKRDEFLAWFIQEKDLELVAVAGTHGKTTTTAMMVWTLQKLGVSISYSIGTQISFGPSGKYDPSSQYFVYECDEFDRNFLHFSPNITLLTSYDYDHPDTYPTPVEYRDAFRQFILQSTWVTAREEDIYALYGDSERPACVQISLDPEIPITLTGAHNRRNASLVVSALSHLLATETPGIVEALNSFPGTARRFEKLAENLYSDYAHHPVEISATIQMALEVNPEVMVIYQPHQNSRQHAVRKYYGECFKNARRIYWLPTYLSREDSQLEILTPFELSKNIEHPPVVISEMNDALWQQIDQERSQGTLIVGMGAGDIDAWLRRLIR